MSLYRPPLSLYIFPSAANIVARLREIGRKEARMRFRAKKTLFSPLQSDKLTFTISRVFEGGDASPPTEHGEEGTNKNGMDEARVFRFILEKVGNEKERSRVFSIREHRTRYTRRGKRMKMTYSRQVVIRAIFRPTRKISSKYDNFNSAV